MLKFLMYFLHLLFCFDLDLHIASSRGRVWLVFCYAFSRNYHACTAMLTWHWCALPIFFWPWPPYNLLPRLCLTWIFFANSHWWVPLCVQRPARAMPFQQIIMHALHYQHDVDVHLLFCFDHDLHITSSRGRAYLGPSSLILTDACSAQQSYAFQQHIMHAL